MWRGEGSVFGPNAKEKLVALATLMAWYSTNAAFAVFAKRAVRLATAAAAEPTPEEAYLHANRPMAMSLDLSLLQLLVGSALGLVLCLLDFVRAGPSTKQQASAAPIAARPASRWGTIVGTNATGTELAVIGVFHMMGGVFTNCGYALQSAPLTQVLKATEPIITVALSTFAFGKVHPGTTHIAVVVIAVGVALFSVRDITFSFNGTVLTMISSVCLPLRNILGKKLNPKIGGSLNTFVVATWISLAVWMPLYLALRFTLFGGIPVGFLAGGDRGRDMLAAGGCHVGCNMSSFLFLGLVTAVTHAVANAIKRLFSLAVSIAVFGAATSLHTYGGIAVVAVGVGLYAYGKTLPAKSTAKTQGGGGGGRKA